MEVFVLSDGTVSGTYRNINEHDEGFVPVSFNVDPSLVFELRSLFEDVESSASTPWINVGYGESGKPLTVKHLFPPPQGQELSTDAKLWDKSVSLCDMCLDE